MVVTAGQICAQRLAVVQGAIDPKFKFAVGLAQRHIMAFAVQHPGAIAVQLEPSAVAGAGLNCHLTHGCDRHDKGALHPHHFAGAARAIGAQRHRHVETLGRHHVAHMFAGHLCSDAWPAQFQPRGWGGGLGRQGCGGQACGGGIAQRNRLAQFKGGKTAITAQRQNMAVGHLDLGIGTQPGAIGQQHLKHGIMHAAVGKGMGDALALLLGAIAEVPQIDRALGQGIGAHHRVKAHLADGGAGGGHIEQNIGGAVGAAVAGTRTDIADIERRAGAHQIAGPALIQGRGDKQIVVMVGGEMVLVLDQGIVAQDPAALALIALHLGGDVLFDGDIG